MKAEEIKTGITETTTERKQDRKKEELSLRALGTVLTTITCVPEGRRQARKRKHIWGKNCLKKPAQWLRALAVLQLVPFPAHV